jgi:hypothetical protein
LTRILDKAIAARIRAAENLIPRQVSVRARAPLRGARIIQAVDFTVKETGFLILISMQKAGISPAFFIWRRESPPNQRPSTSIEIQKMSVFLGKKRMFVLTRPVSSTRIQN